MNIDGRKIMDELVENILIRVRKGNWGSYSFTQHEVYYKDSEKDVTFYFQKDDVVFNVEVYAAKAGEQWLERTLIGYDVYRKQGNDEKIVPYHEFGEIKEHVEKLYHLLKEEVGKIIESHPYFRMQYLFHRDTMIKPNTAMNVLLNKLKREREEGLL